MKTKEQKSKESIAVMIMILAICLIIGGIVKGFMNIEENAGVAFLMCLIGTVLSFISSYMKYGYIKFFN